MSLRFSRAPEAKKQAILKAAVDIVAAQGLTASTRQIAQEAGVSEGTIFNHFAHKDELLNALYLYIKNDLADYAGKERLRALTGRAPVVVDLTQDGWKGLQARLRLLWDSYLNWGLSRPSFVKTLERLAPTGRITLETRLKSLKLFPVFGEFLVNLWHVPSETDVQKKWEDLFLYRSMIALGNQAVEAMYERTETLGPEGAKEEQRKIREGGFLMLWSGISSLIKGGFLGENLSLRDSLLSAFPNQRVGTEASNDAEAFEAFADQNGEVSYLFGAANMKKRRIFPQQEHAVQDEEVKSLGALL